MITDKLIEHTAAFILSQIARAEVVVDGEPQEVAIIHKEAKGNLVRVHTQTGKGGGTIEHIRLFNADNEVVVEKEHRVERSNRYGLVTTFAIRLEEQELTPKEVLRG